MNQPRPAGFWIRAAAALVDFFVFALVQTSYGVVAHRLWRLELEDGWTLGPMVSLFTAIFAAVYTTVLLSLGGQTIGKLVVGVRVVTVDGEVPTVGVAFLRHLCYHVSAAPLMMGFVMAGLRRDRRALHDLLAGTRVERVPRPARPSAPSPPPAETTAPTVPTAL